MHDLDSLNWGILGTGTIARKLAGAIAESTTGNLMAVASRAPDRAEAFGEEFGVPARYGSYEDLLGDAEIDVVYISLPNHLHAQWGIACAEAGKHILCEKPLATNFPEAMTLVEAARHAGVFLLEAFMYRCHPQTARVQQLITEGIVGDVRLIQASFSFDMGPSYDNIRLRNDAAGGGIMDVGCYTMSMARLIAGAAHGKPFVDPVEIEATAHVGDTSRVDEIAVASVRFPGDILATLNCGTQVATSATVQVWGSDGHMEIPNPWFPGEVDNRIVVTRKDRPEPEEFLVQADESLYAIEVDTVAKYLRRGEAPSPAMSWQDSLGNMQALDAWRDAIGLTFDREQPEQLATPVAGRPLRQRPDAPMKYGRIEGLDKPISRAVMGTMIYQPGRLPFTCAMLDYFVEIGGNCLDTAHVYGTEAEVGKWLALRGNREDMVIIGKGAHTPLCNPEGIAQQLAESLDRMGVEYFDIYLLHRDDPTVPVSEFVECLNEHVQAGRMRVFGGSNWSTARLAEANAYAREKGLQGFAASSPNFSLAQMIDPQWPGCIAASDLESRRWYEQTQMPLFAWSSQARGFFTGRYTPEERADETMVRVWFSDENFERLRRARQLAAEKGCTATQIAMAYVLEQPFPTFALIGPQTIEETRTSVLGLDVELSAEERHWLNLEA